MTGLYLLVALAATLAGALTGMGGGVIIKPVLDLLGQYDAASIDALACFTVLTMAMVSVGRYAADRWRGKATERLNAKATVALALGAMAGGYIGKAGLTALQGGLRHAQTATVIQNILLAVTLLVVMLYMREKEGARRQNHKSVLVCVVTGLLLGAFSAFLGIGGGPVNVAVIILVFGCSTKEAALSSLVIILFAQVAKALTILLTGGLASLDLKMLLPMVAGAVAGGALGAQLRKKLSEKAVDRMFQLLQLVILGICVVNIIKNV